MQLMLRYMGNARTLQRRHSLVFIGAAEEETEAKRGDRQAAVAHKELRHIADTLRIADHAPRLRPDQS